MENRGESAGGGRAGGRRRYRRGALLEGLEGSLLPCKETGVRAKGISVVGNRR